MKKNEKFCLAEALRPLGLHLKAWKYLKLILWGVTGMTKLVKSENRKIGKSENRKIGKSENRKIGKSENRKIGKSRM